MEFYARTNNAGSGEFYARTNLVTNLQTIFLQNAEMSSKSLAFNLGFVPDDGDHIYVPQTVAGSALAANSRGIFSLSPAVPDGTTFERITLQVSTGIVRTDTITINDTAGQDLDITATATVAIAGTQSLTASDSLTITGSATVTSSGYSPVNGADDLVVTESAAVTITGSAQISTNVSDSISISESITVTVTGNGYAPNALSVDASATVTSTGSKSEGMAGDVYISAAAAVSVSGYGKLPTNRIFIFD